MGKYVIWLTLLSLRSAEKASPSVLYETVKFDVVIVEEKFVCRAVSSLVVTVDLEGHAVNFKKKKNIFDSNIVEKMKTMGNVNWLHIEKHR